MELLTISLPIFLIIFCGYTACHWTFFNENLLNGLTRLLFLILMPLTLFYEIAKLPFEDIVVWRYMSAYFFASVTVMSMSVLVSNHLFRRQGAELIINLMASCFTNTGFLGLPLFLMLYNTVQPVASVILVQTIFSFFIIMGLNITTTKHKTMHPLTVLRILFENPILIGNSLGIFWSYMHWPLSNIATPLLEIISHSTSYIALFTLGLSLGLASFAFKQQEKVEITLLVILKNITHPLMAYFIGHYCFDLHDFSLQALTLMTAMPTGKNLFILAKRFEAGANRANMIVITTTAIAIVTINFILFIF